MGWHITRFFAFLVLVFLFHTGASEVEWGILFWLQLDKSSCPWKTSSLSSVIPNKKSGASVARVKAGGSTTSERTGSLGTASRGVGTTNKGRRATSVKASSRRSTKDTEPSVYHKLKCLHNWLFLIFWTLIVVFVAYSYLWRCLIELSFSYHLVCLEKGLWWTKFTWPFRFGLVNWLFSFLSLT